MATTVERTYSAQNTPIDRAAALNDLVVTGDNTRTNFAPDKLVGLAESIRDHGLLQPLVVRPTSLEDGEVRDKQGVVFPLRRGYAVIAGERRYRALWLLALARATGEPIAEVATWSEETREAWRDQAGRMLVDVRDIGEGDTAASLEVMLVENLQREDLDPIEEARGYQRLADECGWTQAQIGAAVKRSQPAIANSIRLLGLPEDVRALISAGQLSVSHGVAVAKWKQWPALASAMAAAAVEHRMTSKGVEGLTPGDWQVRDSVRHLDSRAHFDRAVCDACPFGARWTNEAPGYFYSYCLNPDHWDALQAQAEAADQAEQAARLAARGIGVADVPRLEGMPYSSYRDLAGGCPPGCSDACPCRSQAVNRWDKVVPICTDPKRYAKLERAKTVAENQGKREKEKVLADRMTGRLDAIEGTGTRRELVVLVKRAVDQLDRKPLEQVIKRLGLPLDVDPVKEYDHRQSGTPWRTLMRLSDHDLVRLGVECLLAYDLQGLRNGNSSGQLVTWYLKAGTGADDAAPVGEGDDAA